MSLATDVPVETTSEAETPLVTVTEGARKMVVEARSAETDGDSLALWLEANDAPGGKFRYDMWFQAPDGPESTATIVTIDGLRLVIPATSVSRLKGATLDIATDGSGMVLLNPNEPSAPAAPSATAEGADLSSPLAQEVLRVIEQKVNPSIASHGGYAQLVGVDGDTVWLKMGGGCQGCAASKMTLRQGIEVSIKEAVPSIVNVIDVTDHQAGDNPYYK